MASGSGTRLVQACNLVVNLVNLVRIVHRLIRLIDQVQEAPEGNEEVKVHYCSEPRGSGDKVLAGPLPVALKLWLDHTLLHVKPQAEECFQLRNRDRQEVLGVV